MAEMCKLNVYHHELRPNEYAEFYLKYEADKVIAELEERHKMEVEQLLIEIAELKEKHKTEVKELLCLIRDKENNFNRAFDSEEKELQHQKYKRCLAMSELCQWKMGVFIYKKEKSDFYWRWHKRWLELAMKFKEAK